MIRNVRSKKQPEWNKNLSLFGFPETFSCATFNVQFTITSQIGTLIQERSNDEQDSSLEKVTQHKDPLRKIMIILYKH